MRVLLWLLPAALVAALVATAADPPPEVPVTPAEVIAACAADLAKLGPVPPGVRYVSLHNWPAKDRDVMAKVISGHVNGLSREPDIVPPVRVGAWLLRIDADDYGKVFAQQWERLGVAEPYWHDADEQLAEDEYETVDVEYGYWVRPDGSKRAGGARKHADERWETTRTEKERRKKATRTVRGFAGWAVPDGAAKKAFETMQAKLGGTDAPVVTAEWLLAQTAVQFQRTPGYYDFLGVKDQRTYEAAIGFTEKGVDPGFLRELREAVANGTVTGPDVVRRLVRYEKVGGGYWFSQDVNLRQAKDPGRANATTNLGDDLEFQAVEAFGHLPNGMWATGLFSDRGERQDVAPDFIASDGTAPHADRRVHVNLGCLRCHTDGGLQPIDGWVRNVLNSPPNFLATKDAKAARELRQQYTRRLEPYLQRDRDRYNAALFEATGMKSAEYAAAYAKAWQRAAEDPVTVERAARDLGCTVDALQKALAAQGEKVDPDLAAFRLPKPRAIPVVVWYRSYARAQDALRGVARPFKVKEVER